MGGSSPSNHSNSLMPVPLAVVLHANPKQTRKRVTSSDFSHDYKYYPAPLLVKTFALLRLLLRKNRCVCGIIVPSADSWPACDTWRQYLSKHTRYFGLEIVHSSSLRCKLKKPTGWSPPSICAISFQLLSFIAQRPCMSEVITTMISPRSSITQNHSNCQELSPRPAIWHKYKQARCA